MRILAIAKKVLKELLREYPSYDVFGTNFYHVADECHVFG